MIFTIKKRFVPFVLFNFEHSLKLLRVFEICTLKLKKYFFSEKLIKHFTCNAILKWFSEGLKKERKRKQAKNYMYHAWILKSFLTLRS